MSIGTIVGVSLLVSLFAVSAAAAQEELACADDSPPIGAAWLDLMPQPVDTTVTRFDVQVPSADGTLLSARVYLPDAFDGPRPTILWFGPYRYRRDHGGSLRQYFHAEREALGITSEDPECISRLQFFVRRGYAFVVASLRGTGNSRGCIDWGGVVDGADGDALVNWVSAQSWSDGTVGMRGVSWEAISQYATAIDAPPALGS